MKVRQIDLEKAFLTRDISEFMDEVFPTSWNGIKARIIETGVIFVDADPNHEKFALGWSFITPVTRLSKRGNERETWFKSIIFRVHDVLHQLFSLFVPQTWEDDELYQLKRMWMCAEVAVLTLTEFVYCQWLYGENTFFARFPSDTSAGTIHSRMCVNSWSIEIRYFSKIQRSSAENQHKISPRVLINYCISNTVPNG